MSTEITCMEHAYTVSFYLECILLSRRVAFHLHAKEFRYGIPMGMECTQSKRLAVTKITVFPTRTDFKQKNVKTNIVFYECAAFLHTASGKQLKI